MSEHDDLLSRPSIWHAIHDELDDLAEPARTAATDRVVFRFRRLLEAQAVRELRNGLSFKANWLLSYADGLEPSHPSRAGYDQPAP